MSSFFDFDEHLGDLNKMRRLLDVNEVEKAIVEGRLKENWDIREIDGQDTKGYIIHGRSESDPPMEPLEPFEPLKRRRRPPAPERLVVHNSTISDVSEPLIDIFIGEAEVKVYVELPIGETDELQLNVTEHGIEVKAKDFYKLIKVPVNVDIDKASSKRKNRVLEIILPKKISIGESRKNISID